MFSDYGIHGMGDVLLDILEEDSIKWLPGYTTIGDSIEFCFILARRIITKSLEEDSLAETLSKLDHLSEYIQSPRFNDLQGWVSNPQPGHPLLITYEQFKEAVMTEGHRLAEAERLIDLEGVSNIG